MGGRGVVVVVVVMVTKVIRGHTALCETPPLSLLLLLYNSIGFFGNLLCEAAPQYNLDLSGPLSGKAPRLQSKLVLALFISPIYYMCRNVLEHQQVEVAEVQTKRWR